MPGRSEDISENQKLIQRSIVKIWPFVCYYVEKKHKEDLPSPVSSTIGSMGVAKIGTDTTPV